MIQKTTKKSKSSIKTIFIVYRVVLFRFLFLFLNSLLKGVLATAAPITNASINILIPILIKDQIVILITTGVGINGEILVVGRLLDQEEGLYREVVFIIAMFGFDCVEIPRDV